jgi:hypothetical protein
VRTYDNQEEYVANTKADAFAGKPGVTVAFAGEKIAGGQPTGQRCIVVGVEKKLDKDQLADAELVPSEIDGIPTDVIEFPRLRALGTCTGGGGGGCPPHDEKWRPLIGGISAIVQGSTACTMGVIVRDSTDQRVVALTNNHCAGLLYDPDYKVPTFGSLSVVGLNMLQPSPYDGGTIDDKYGEVKRAVAMQFGTGAGASNIVDCAISGVPVGESDFKILELVSEGPYPFGEKALYSIGQQVLKVGRTTGVTPPPTTAVTSKSAVVNVDYSGGGGGDNNLATFTDQIICSAASRFSQGGDSGSAVVALINGRYRIIGLHFAGNSTGTLGVCCPIEEIAEFLDVEAWDGRVVVPYTAEMTLVVNGKTYVRVENTANPVTHYADSSSSSSSG